MNFALIEKKRCPSCGASRGTRATVKLPLFSVYACVCGIKFLDPSLDEQSQMGIYQNSQTLKEINPALEQYYEYETLEPQSRTAHDYEKALGEVGIMALGRDLCEIGCGNGGFLAYAKSRGWQVTGIDSSPENIQQVLKRGADGIHGDVFQYHSDRRFDVVVLWDVLEHPQDPGRLLKKCRELLKPDGCLLIALPYDPNIISFLAHALYLLSFGCVKAPAAKWYVLEHTSYFSKKGLRNLLGRNDFRLIKWWKTETDLSRYKFGFLSRGVLRVLFGLGRIFGAQNRLIVVAKKG